MPDRMEARFYSKVQGGPDCWIWRGTVATNGYGRFWYLGRMQPAHKVAWILSGKTIPKGHEMCHKCDNRRCVRMSHLFTGTRKDNMQDALRKGRTRYKTIAERKHCRNGHLYRPHNTGLAVAGTRVCLTCRDIWREKNHDKLKAQWTARNGMRKERQIKEVSSA